MEGEDKLLAWSCRSWEGGGSHHGHQHQTPARSFKPDRRGTFRKLGRRGCKQARYGSCITLLPPAALITTVLRILGDKRASTPAAAFQVGGVSACVLVWSGPGLRTCGHHPVLILSLLPPHLPRKAEEDTAEGTHPPPPPPAPPARPQHQNNGTRGKRTSSFWQM